MTPKLNPRLELSPLIDELKQRKEATAQRGTLRQQDQDSRQEVFPC
jgi:hypothetical protein